MQQEFLYVPPQGELKGFGYLLETQAPHRIVKAWAWKSDDDCAAQVAQFNEGEYLLNQNYNIAFTFYNSLQPFKERELKISNYQLLRNAMKFYYFSKIKEKEGFYKKYLKG